MTTDWIMTASGKAFWPLEPRGEDIDIEDIAHALAATNRFNGHTREPYSVAQHPVLMSGVLWDCAPDDGTAARYALYGLLHDASEAYLGDVPRPLKKLEAFAPYRDAERILQAEIYRVFGLAADEPLALKDVDRRMLRTEQAYLMPPPAHGEDRTDAQAYRMVILPWPFAYAKACFLQRFRELQFIRERLTA